MKDRGVQVDLAYFRPGHTLAKDALREYEGNVLTVARQLYYSAKAPKNSLDLALLVNGLPTATIELKNPMTGQGIEQAKEQYRNRDQHDLMFAKRAVVHFAVDPDEAAVTTRLSGRDTRFLPFNVGSNGPGKSGGKGNPPPADGSYAVDYLWRDIWQRDAWLEILQRFLHVQDVDAKGKKLSPHSAERIFPRYHQWHAVTRMVEHARQHRAGHSYLVEHSAGSGKSNTIAWLAHRLSNLFDIDNQPVFHKTIIVTDRVVLDRQLQRTIYQFDHEPGVVRKIDEDSNQLAAVLTDSTSKIVISTMQKFPFVLDKIEGKGLGDRRYAVVIDEAHTSQGGDAALRIKQAVGANAVRGEDESEAAYLIRARGRQPNLSYFAFTATPTSPTLKLFGTKDPARVDQRTGEPVYEPFHVYSMRQAIDEGFILDVLANYLTYETKWRLRNAAVENQESDTGNPEVDERKAKAKLVRLAQAHHESLGQKAKLIVADFVENIEERLGGRAKAMVVTDGRQRALDLYQAIHRHLHDDVGRPDLGALVAFSGTLKDEATGVERSEAMINGFPEVELPRKFAYTKADDPDATKREQTEFRLLVVADKYQTGFDQPLLCAMYVDKALTGVAAVQTLSRLNRTHPLKDQDDVRVLDFANTPDAIKSSFAPWFETTLTTEGDPNLLYRKQREVMDFGLLHPSEMESFMRVLEEAPTGRQAPAVEKKLHAKLHEYLTPPIDRFVQLEDVDTREDFRSKLHGYVRAYGLLAQVLDWGDEELERLYQYGRLLLLRLPGRPTATVDIGDADLSHFRLQETGRHDLSLTPDGDQTVRGHAADGGGVQEPEMARLADVIAELNDQFGFDLGTSDEILVYQQVVGLVEDPAMNQIALVNSEERFGQVADDKLDDIVADNAERNTEFMKRYFDNEEFQKAIKAAARKRAYRIIREPAREEALGRLRAEMRRETEGHGTR
ncbi:DEAD/DEAH box helicase family protein [Actinomycetospora sp. NBRC 106378]|uniref:type I restriction endonuclease subunit R n=1 Tax=Actinomycetospora sp. NBRC 106378 TaxID=3032208 RepID=UPI0024A55A9E|nr:DEAD/DEAH box helicase family protein [Actinomycetospora sp. NBRC 106378]GLZ54134.1 type I restriction endonuclease subunit R [Actinomycetospora sp. NBRC 106378]